MGATMKKGKVYRFHVIKNGINDDGNYYSIIERESGEEDYYFPFYLSKEGEYDLKVTNIKNGDNYFFSLEHELIREYTSGEHYHFDVIDTLDIDNNGVTQTFLEVVDKLGIRRTVKPFSWQYNNGEPRVDEVLCNARIESNKLYLRQDIGNLKHPHFEIGETYLLEVAGVDQLKESTINLLKLKGPDNVTYHVKAHFFQHSKEVVGDKIECKYKGLDNNGEVILEQVKDEFVNFNEVFVDQGINKENLFDEIKFNSSDRFKKLNKDYNNRENIWVFSICEGLKDLIEEKLNRYDYEVGVKYIDYLITAEEWILQSGFLKTFGPEKRELSKYAAENIIKEYKSLKESISLIINYEAREYLRDFFEKLDVEIKQKEYNAKLKRVLEILRFTNRETIDSEYIVGALRKLKKVGLLGNGEIRKFADIVFKRVLDLRGRIFTHELPNFESNIKTKQEALEEYAKLLYLYSFLHFKLSNLALTANGLAQYFRALSFIVDNQTKKYNSIIASILITHITQELKSPDLEKYFKTNVKPPETTQIVDFVTSEVEESRNNDQYIKEVIQGQKENSKMAFQIEGINDNYIEVKHGDVYGIIPKRLYLDAIKNEDLKHGIDVNVLEVFSDAKLFIGAKDSGFKLSSQKDNWSKIFDTSKDIETRREKFIEELSVDEHLVGSVKSVENDIGVFVNLGLIDGLIPPSLITWERDVTPSDYFSKGQIIRCCVHRKGEGKVTLSTQVYFEEPWDKFGKKIRKDRWHVAKVVNTESFGVFFDLAPKFTGLLHVKNIKIDIDLTKYFNIGDTYLVYVEEFDLADEKIELTNFREVKPTDFSDREVLNLWKQEKEENDSWFINEDLRKYPKDSIFQLAYNFRNIANIKKDFNKKVEALEWSKFFFSLNRSKHSYLADYYIKYFKTIQRFAQDGSEKNDMDYVRSLVKEIADDEIIEDKFPIINNVERALKILSKYGDSSYKALHFLLKKAYDDDVKEVNQNLSRLIISNNILENEEIDKSFYERNKKTIIKYLEDGVLQLKDLTEENDEVSGEIREIISLIEQGESKKIEFKATLATPILTSKEKRKIEKLEELVEDFEKQGNKNAVKAKKNKIQEIKNLGSPTEVKHSAMKAIASFANSEGGTLLIGVDDITKEVIGLEADYNRLQSENKRDHIRQLFDNVIEDFITENIHACIEEVGIFKVNDVDIMRIKVSKSLQPIFLEKGRDGNTKNAFYVRRSASVRELDPKEAMDYVNNRMLKG